MRTRNTQHAARTAQWLAERIVARYRAAAPRGFDPQAISFTVTPGKIFSDTESWTAAKFNQLGQPTISATGTLSSSDFAAGAVTATKATPGPWFYATSTSGAGIVSTTKFTLAWGSNTPPASLADGLEIAFKVDAANTGTVSIDTGTGGASGVEKALKKLKGEDMEAGDLRANQMIICRYGTVAGEWQLVSPLANRPVEYLTASGTDTYTITPSPAYVSLAQLTGRRFAIKFTNANTGPATLNPNTLGALGIKKNKDQPLVAGDIKAGQIIEFICDDASPQIFQMQGQLGNPPNSPGISGATRNLIITNNGTTKIDLSADEITLRSSTLGAYITVIPPAPLTIDPSGSGALGLDNGVAAANTWYYVWAIYNPTTAALSAFCSLSTTAPTPVIGYTYKALLGAFRITAIGPIVIATLYQRDKAVSITDTNIFTAKAAAIANTYEVLAGADLTAFQAAIPPIAKTLIGTAGASAGLGAFIGVAADANGLGAQAIVISAAAAAPVNAFAAAAAYQIPLSTQNLNWKCSDLVARNRLSVSGYSI